MKRIFLFLLILILVLATIMFGGHGLVGKALVLVTGNLVAFCYGYLMNELRYQSPDDSINTGFFSMALVDCVIIPILIFGFTGVTVVISFVGFMIVYHFDR